MRHALSDSDYNTLKSYGVKNPYDELPETATPVRIKALKTLFPAVKDMTFNSQELWDFLSCEDNALDRFMRDYIQNLAFKKLASPCYYEPKWVETLDLCFKKKGFLHLVAELLLFHQDCLSQFEYKLTPDQWFEVLAHPEVSLNNVKAIEVFFKMVHADSFDLLHEVCSEQWIQLLTSANTADNIHFLSQYTVFLRKMVIPFNGCVELLASPFSDKKHLMLLKQGLALEYLEPLSEIEMQFLQSVFDSEEKQNSVIRFQTILPRFNPRCNVTNFLSLLDLGPDETEAKVSLLVVFPILLCFEISYVRRTLASPDVSKLERLMIHQQGHCVALFGDNHNVALLYALIEESFCLSELLCQVNFTVPEWKKILNSEHIRDNIEHLEKYMNFLYSLKIPSEIWLETLTSPYHAKKHLDLLKQALSSEHSELLSEADEQALQDLFDPEKKSYHIICCQTNVAILSCLSPKINLTDILYFAHLESDELESYFSLLTLFPIASWFDKYGLVNILAALKALMAHQEENCVALFGGGQNKPLLRVLIDAPRCLMKLLQVTPFTAVAWERILMSSDTLENVNHLEPYMDFLCQLPLGPTLWGRALTSACTPTKHIRLLKNVFCIADDPIDEDALNDDEWCFQAIFKEPSKYPKLIFLISMQASFLSRFSPRLNLADIVWLLNLEQYSLLIITLTRLPSLFCFDKHYLFNLFTSTHKLSNLITLFYFEYANFFDSLGPLLSQVLFDHIVCSSQCVTDIEDLTTYLKTHDRHSLTTAQLIEVVTSSHTERVQLLRDHHDHSHEFIEHMMLLFGENLTEQLSESILHSEKWMSNLQQLIVFLKDIHFFDDRTTENQLTFQQVMKILRCSVTRSNLAQISCSYRDALILFKPSPAQIVELVTVNHTNLVNDLECLLASTSLPLIEKPPRKRKRAALAAASETNMAVSHAEKSSHYVSSNAFYPPASSNHTADNYAAASALFSLNASSSSHHTNVNDAALTQPSF